MRRVRPIVVLGLLGDVALLAAVVLWFDNASVDVSAATTTRPAPPARSGAASPHGTPFTATTTRRGEHTQAYDDEVAAECYSANLARHRASIASGVGAVVLLVATAGVAVWSSRSVSA